jgi:hypothetical protein
LKQSCKGCIPYHHGRLKKDCAARKTACVVPPSSPPIEEPPTLTPKPEIKQEPFNIHGYYDMGDEGE